MEGNTKGLGAALLKLLPQAEEGRHIVVPLLKDEDEAEAARKAAGLLKGTVVAYGCRKVRPAEGFAALPGRFCDSFRSTPPESVDVIFGRVPEGRLSFEGAGERGRLRRLASGFGLEVDEDSGDIWQVAVALAMRLLRPGGIMAVALPRSMATLSSAKPVRLFLEQQAGDVTLVGTQDCRLLLMSCRKTSDPTRKHLRAVGVPTFGDFASRQIPAPGWMRWPEMPWSVAFLPREERRIIGAVEEAMRRRDDSTSQARFAPMYLHAEANDGIRTGNDAFFIPTKEQLLASGLGRNAQPCLRDVPGGVLYTEQDAREAWTEADARTRVVLLPPKDVAHLAPKAASWVRKGIREHADKQWLRDGREKWYSIPVDWMGQVAVGRVADKAPRLVLDRAGAWCVSPADRIRMSGGMAPERLVAAFHNSVTYLVTELYGKKLDDGRLLLHPGVLRRLPIPDLARLGQADAMALLGEADGIFRSSRSEEDVLDLIDRKVLEDRLGVRPDVCRSARQAWKALRNERVSYAAAR